MNHRRVGLLTCLLTLACTSLAYAGGKYHKVTYPTPDKKEPNLQLDYTIWIPDGVPKLRGIIIHTHGSGAFEAGADAAYDLHWQALAKKWDCALLAPSFQHGKTKKEHNANWHRYFVPGGGSRNVFLGALHDLSVKSNHPELETVPWCLWGHSAGAIWSGLMHAHDPDRIIAIWLRSGSGWGFAEKGFIPNWKLVPTEANRGVPVILNSGMRPHPTDANDDDGRKDAQGMLRAFRPKDAPVGIAHDPRTGHNCGDSRLLAIPYFDTMLKMRLPDKGSTDQKLKPVDMKVAWLADPSGDKAVPVAQYKGDPMQAAWLPNERFAKMWMEYVKTGYVTDTTPPPAPTNVKAVVKAGKSVELTWNAEVDFESGLRTFIIQRDGERIGRTEPVAKSRSGTVPIDGRPLFQGLSYHDTPLEPRREMRYVDQEPPPGAKHVYQVIAVNSAGLRSEPVTAKTR
jgi:hypothetical protein